MSADFARHTVKAVLLGDSHAAVINEACEAQGLRFAAAVTMAAENYVDATLVEDPDVGLVLKPGPTASTKRTAKLAKRAAKTSAGLERAMSLRLPVISTIGLAGHLFVRGLQLDTNLERSDLEERAAAHFSPYLEFYKIFRRRVPSVTAILGPPRFTHETRCAWQCFEDVATQCLNEIGVSVLDLRAELLDSQSLFRQEFRAPDPKDQVHASLEWGQYVFDAIKDQLKSS